MHRALRVAGFDTHLIGYPSTRYPIAELAKQHLLPQLRALDSAANGLDFVTHSMGGILLRYLTARGLLSVGRAVMLGPPNQGSEAVDALGKWGLFGLINGPAGRELGTGADSVTQALGAVEFELGVIAGNRSINPLLSLIIPGADDGKVAVARARVDGMSDFLIVPATHTFIMDHPRARRETEHFLRHGRFQHSRTAAAG